MTEGDVDAPSGVAAEAQHDIMYELDLATGDIHWNRALYTMLGYHEAEPLNHSQWWIEHIHPDDAMRLNQALDKIIDPTFPNWTVDYRFRKADNTYALVRDRASILRDGNGKAVQVIGTLTPLKSVI